MVLLLLYFLDTENSPDNKFAPRNALLTHLGLKSRNLIVSGWLQPEGTKNRSQQQQGQNLCSGSDFFGQVEPPGPQEIASTRWEAGGGPRVVRSWLLRPQGLYYMPFSQSPAQNSWMTPLAEVSKAKSLHH